MDQDKFELFQKVFEKGIPFNQVMGLKLISAGDGEGLVRFDFRDDLIGNSRLGILHGGIIAAALDVVGAVAVLSRFIDEGTEVGIGTVDMRVDYLTPAKGKFFNVTGTVMRFGRILCSSRMELANDEGEMHAIGTAVYRLSKIEKFVDTNL